MCIAMQQLAPASGSLLPQHVSLEDQDLLHESSVEPLNPADPLSRSEECSISAQSSSGILPLARPQRHSLKEQPTAFVTRTALRTNESSKWLSQLPAWQPAPSERARDLELSSQEGSFTQPGRPREDSTSIAHEANPGWRGLGNRISTHLRR